MSDNVGVYGDDDLIAYWKFNSIENSIAMDVSANGTMVPLLAAPR